MPSESAMNAPGNWLARPPLEMGVAMADQWSVVLPRIFRYMDQQFIDEFFESGHLRLSSFHHFKSHTDVERLDENEGVGVNVGVYQSPDDPEDASTVYMVTGTGQNLYVLCGSIVESDELTAQFGTDGYFVIENPVGFANEVRRYLPGCQGGLQGHCIYPPNGRGVSRRLDQSPVKMFEDAKREDGTVDMGVLPTVAGLTVGNEGYFIKPAKYRHQAEYRMLWRMDHSVQGFIDLVVPSARQFCVKVT